MATPIEIETAITNGLVWLVQQQNADGSWGSEGTYPIGRTGLVLLKLEAYALQLGYNTPFVDEYIYKSNVENGLEYLFKNAVKDANDNIYFVELGKICYQTGIALAAICANADPTHNVGNVGNPVVDGKTYKEVANSMVAYLALAQNANGGWAYEPFTGDIPDNSVSGYVVLGLEIASVAKYKFNCVIPASIKTGLNNWISYIQNDNGGSGYQNKFDWVNILKTGNLIQEMRLYGDSVSEARVQKAIQYIADNWNDLNTDPGWRGDPASYQATFTTMKGLSGYGIQTIGADIDWYADVSNVIVSQQLPDGSWPHTMWDYDVQPILSTTWALLTLEKDIIPVPPSPLTREAIINLLLASIGFEELGLAHVINAEAEKIQYVLGTIEGQTRLETPPTIDHLLTINRSVDRTLRTVIEKEMILQFKLEDVLTYSKTTTSTTSTTTTTTEEPG